MREKKAISAAEAAELEKQAKQQREAGLSTLQSTPGVQADTLEVHPAGGVGAIEGGECDDDLYDGEDDDSDDDDEAMCPLRFVLVILGALGLVKYLGPASSQKTSTDRRLGRELAMYAAVLQSSGGAPFCHCSLSDAEAVLTMGCSGSLPVAEGGGKRPVTAGHGFDIDDLESLLEEGAQMTKCVNTLDRQLSIQSMKMDVSDAPSPCPPIECTHRRHVQRLQMFLKEVKDDPAALEVEVADRRMDEFGVDTGHGCADKTEGSDVKGTGQETSSTRSSVSSEQCRFQSL
ncbi:hypothetical protein AK812_SmicGene21133 [Symbiodinium microadriaticum]|uniref:Uncharacterized protein n=1 Tax=Symbiodinium microadriaticum TaxID=2951 RepID=A0A1Q9DN84_SYMMI|nr:hypothetical protein AK812_SmicGene21133 [Symbiodinium microadriaticum]